jgi:serine protease Do
MSYRGHFKSALLVLGIGIIFTLVGMVIGSNLSIPEKLTAQPRETAQATASVNIASNTGHSPFVAVAEEVRPAVVNISAESVTKERFHTFMGDDFFRRFFGLPQDQIPNRPLTQRTESLGSGFVFQSDGHIMTNNHVVEGAEKVTVTLSDGHKYNAEIIGRDKDTDIAVLKISAGHDLPTILLGDSDSIMVGDWVMAVGNPFPNLGLDRTVTVGVVSAKGRQGLSFGSENPSYQNYIQTDASINPGNSGGPLVNLQGQAIGVNAAIATPTGGNVGIGFAVPIDMAKAVAEQLMKSGKVARGYLGIFPQDITEDLKEANSLPSTEGILVAQVDSNTPAEKAGLRAGDVVVQFDGKKVMNAQQFRFLVADAGPGKSASLKIWRNGSDRTVDVELGDRDKFMAQAHQKPAESEQNDNKWWGLTVETLTEDNAAQFGMNYTPGVVITSVEPGSVADNAGLQQGDIILKISGKEVRTSEEFARIAGQLKKSSKAISFYVRRGQANMFIAVTPD